MPPQNARAIMPICTVLNLLLHHLSCGLELAHMRAHIPGYRLRVSAARYRPHLVRQLLHVLRTPADLCALLPFLHVGEERPDVPGVERHIDRGIHLSYRNRNSVPTRVSGLPYANIEHKPSTDLAANNRRSVLNPATVKANRYLSIVMEHMRRIGHPVPLLRQDPGVLSYLWPVEVEALAHVNRSCRAKDCLNNVRTIHPVRIPVGEVHSA